jgi:predicted nucleic acid-binding protein
LAVKRLNVTIDPIVYEEFIKYAEKKGVKISPYINAKMKEFVEEEKRLEKEKLNQK